MRVSRNMKNIQTPNWHQKIGLEKLEWSTESGKHKNMKKCLRDMAEE